MFNNASVLLTRASMNTRLLCFLLQPQAGTYIALPHGESCPEDQVILTAAECAEADRDVVLSFSRSWDNTDGIRYESNGGWGGYPRGCFYHDVPGGGLHFAGPAAAAAQRSDCYVLCHGSAEAAFFCASVMTDSPFHVCCTSSSIVIPEAHLQRLSA